MAWTSVSESGPNMSTLVAAAADRIRTALEGREPDLVIVCFGTNDRKLDVATFRLGLNELCQRIEAAGATVLLRTTLPIMELEPAPPHIWKNDGELRERLDVVREVAQARQLAFVDNYAAWCEREDKGRLVIKDLMADQIHSNAAGHRLIFEQLLEHFPR